MLSQLSYAPGYFAEFYDSFTDDVNYDKIEKFVCSLLSREGINGGAFA